MENKDLFYAEQFVLYTNHNIFLTGKAGTGKTTFLKEILKKTHKQSVVVAPTGVAAINAGGVTIHSMFQLPTTSFIPTSDFINPEWFTNTTELAKIQKLRKDKRKVLQELELLVIDEISMVRADLLDAIDLTLRRIRKSHLPFGGVQILAIGDLFQLAPVVKEHTWNVLKNYYKSPFFFSSIAWQKSNAHSIELTEVYRQADPTFVNILNRIRTGVSDEKDLALINKRFVEKTKSDIITLTTHNNKADAINNKELSNLETPSITLKAKITGKFYESAYPAPENFTLKEGAQIMFIKNHPEGLYFNGKLGILVGQEKNLLRIHLNDDHKTILVDKEEWKNTTYKVNQNTKEIEKEDLGSFFQYPIRLAWAVTVHKSQGLTFDELQLDLEKSFAAGQLYVALSRCRSLEGLHLLSKIKQNNVIVDDRILDFYKSIAFDSDIDALLESSKLKYDNFQLKASFAFQKYLDNIIECQKYVVDKIDGKHALDIISFVKNLKTSFSNIIQTSNKFQAQLESLYGDSDNDVITQRADSAIRYFTDEINSKIILPIESVIDKYKSEGDIRKHLKSFVNLCDEFWFLMQHLYSIKYKNEKVFTGEIKYKPERKIQSKTKYKKGDTYAETLELFKAGKSLKQIADIRLLAKSTIESHMLHHVKEGQVSAKDLVKKSRYDKILRYVQSVPDKSVTDIVKDIGFEITYMEARWIKAELELLMNASE